MKLEEARWLRAALPTGRSLFSYYKDRYSLQLLRYAVRHETSVGALRTSPIAGLLQKPRVRALLAGCDGKLSPSFLREVDGDPVAERYVLTLGLWSGSQMTRPGANLVLQLNFNSGHDRPFRRLLAPAHGRDPFNYPGHPTLEDNRSERRYTLAWARFDIDLDRGEALIEEIQSDWVRRAKRIHEHLQRYRNAAMLRRLRLKPDVSAMQRYYAHVLAPHMPLWDEAMLSASLFFLREELGIKRIYMHTPASGRWLKDIDGRAPPRSLYSTLPRRFCFAATESLPRFLERARVFRVRAAHPDARLQVLPL